jgi:hypothetical protein
VKSITSWCDYEQSVAYQHFSIVAVSITKLLQTIHKSFLKAQKCVSHVVNESQCTRSAYNVITDADVRDKVYNK